MTSFDASSFLMVFIEYFYEREPKRNFPGGVKLFFRFLLSGRASG